MYFVRVMHRLLQFFVPAATKVSLAININFSGLSFDLLDISKKNVLQIFIHTIKFYSHVFSILFYINFDSSTEIHTRSYVGEIPFCTLYGNSNDAFCSGTSYGFARHFNYKLPRFCKRVSQQIATFHFIFTASTQKRHGVMFSV